MRRKRSSVFVLMIPVVLLAAACSDDGGTPGDTVAPSSTVGSTVDMTGECQTGTWVSTGMTFPGQAAITEITPTGGGDGMDIELGPTARSRSTSAR